ncbi:hypothetical protein E2562_012998 [Oryza meyeriana var. granulata]|uniref:Ribonuclease n=1 Tax=Oryza meyeriana var. granulata TaxID=110450 RepID=A0A6G1DIS3_9ORYZ|nr:hypothetical protein E2562_012998 [Oryza meyeriana var. granulata]
MTIKSMGKRMIYWRNRWLEEQMASLSSSFVSSKLTFVNPKLTQIVSTIVYLLAKVYIDTVGDVERYRIKLTEKFPGIKFVVAKKADNLFPVVSGASIVAKVTRDRALRNWVFDETAQNMHMNTGSGYPGDPATKQWLEDHKHPIFGFPTLVRFSWGTCTPFFNDAVEVTWESDELEEDAGSNGSVKRQVKLSSLGFTGFKRKSEEIESSGKGRCKFFQACKLELVRKF